MLSEAEVSPSRPTKVIIPQQFCWGIFYLRKVGREVYPDVALAAIGKHKKSQTQKCLACCSGNRTRTCDLRVMSPTSYLLLYPAILDCKYTTDFYSHNSFILFLYVKCFFKKPFIACFRERYLLFHYL